MELNQEKIITDYVKDMRTSYTQLEKRDEEMEVMKIKHSDHVATIVEKCTQKMDDMRIDMQSQHAKEMETMEINHSNHMTTIQNLIAI